MRIERIVLEDHGDIPLFRRNIIHDALTDADRSPGNALQAGDHPEKGRLAAPGGADQDHEFSVDNINIDAVNDRVRPKTLADVLNLN
ncbi:hypothetical protein ABIF63_003420 [Bradyrhizobium japonicum]|uniref:Uncharacterized protein n=1 Tax=Bradyrhizobium japonicum TaxID=375 RepID=A0ABV2RQW8_BRAJP